MKVASDIANLNTVIDYVSTKYRNKEKVTVAKKAYDEARVTHVNALRVLTGLT
ncbi:MAG: hypothetical protein QW752_05395 [Thermoplasmata archaeon]